MIICETICPFIDTDPAVGSIFPARAAKSVVFPAPLEKNDRCGHFQVWHSTTLVVRVDHLIRNCTVSSLMKIN